MSDELTIEQITNWIAGLKYDLSHPSISWTPSLLAMLLEIHLVRLMRDVIDDKSVSKKLFNNCGEFLHVITQQEITTTCDTDT